MSRRDDSEGELRSAVRPKKEQRAPAARARYTIDDLAALTGVPSRTIRFYQAKGALESPERRGRVAYYDDTHAERLKLVGHLQDRGLNLRAIRDLLSRAEGGDVSVAEWLGVGDKLRAPWTDDRSQICSEEELEGLIGASRRPGLIAELVRSGLVHRETSTHPPSYLVPSVGLLQMALKLDAAGISLEVAAGGHEILRKRLSKAADELAQYFVTRTELGEKGPGEASRSVEALRSIGMDVVRLVFAQEIERALNDMVKDGRALPPKRRRGLRG